MYIWHNVGVVWKCLKDLKCTFKSYCWSVVISNVFFPEHLHWRSLKKSITHPFTMWCFLCCLINTKQNLCWRPATHTLILQRPQGQMNQVERWHTQWTEGTQTENMNMSGTPNHRYMEGKGGEIEKLNMVIISQTNARECLIFLIS